MTQQVEQKLTKLSKEYGKTLPQKISNINVLWNGLKNSWNSDNLLQLHQEVHKMHGAAGIFGYESLSEIAEQLEQSLKAVLEKKPSEKQKRKIELLILKLRNHIGASSKTLIHSPKEISRSGIQEGAIYLFQKDTEAMKRVAQQLKSFGCIVKTIATENALIKAIKQRLPSIVMLDLDLLTPSLNSMFIDIRRKEVSNQKHLLIFFIGSKNNFSEHMQSIQAGGQAYFTKPISIDEVIATVTAFKGLHQNPYKILIVEDEQNTAEYYALLLQTANMCVHIVYQAKDLNTALSEFKPDLILMDLYMPHYNGLELTRFIRQQRAYEGIPIIFLSSEVDEQKHLEALRLGVDDFITKSTKPTLLILKIKNKVRRYRILRGLISKDSLTGVFNHSTIQQALVTELKLASRLKTPLSLVMIDLDYFKKVNDIYGHLMGDHLLKRFSWFCISNLRETDYFGRWGGEEFVIILPNTSGDSAAQLINKLRENFAQLYFSQANQTFAVTFSAGIGTYPKYQTAQDIIKAADDNLYLAKEQGRNQICIN